MEFVWIKLSIENGKQLMYFSPCVLSVSVALILIDNVKYFALDKLIQPKKNWLSAPHSERSTKHINITYLIFFFLTRKSKMPLIYFDSKLCAQIVSSKCYSYSTKVTHEMVKVLTGCWTLYVSGDFITKAWLNYDHYFPRLD